MQHVKAINANLYNIIGNNIVNSVFLLFFKLKVEHHKAATKENKNAFVYKTKNSKQISITIDEAT